MRYPHEALVWQEPEELADAAAAFHGHDRHVRPLLVLLPPWQLAPVRERLDELGGDVRYVDATEVGRNPARILPFWQAFVDASAGEESVRAIVGAVWPQRTPAELVECARHEWLLDLAISRRVDVEVLCPYEAGIGTPVLARARRLHPGILQAGTESASPDYLGPAETPTVLQARLPEPLTAPLELTFFDANLSPIRHLVVERAREAGLDDREAEDFVTAANEIVTNSLQYGGGLGRLRIWSEGRTVFCEVRDCGHFADPLVGRVRPSTERESGRGLWVANQICDLVEVRALPGGSVVRLRLAGRGKTS